MLLRCNELHSLQTSRIGIMAAMFGSTSPPEKRQVTYFSIVGKRRLDRFQFVGEVAWRNLSKVPEEGKPKPSMVALFSRRS